MLYKLRTSFSRSKFSGSKPDLAAYFAGKTVFLDDHQHQAAQVLDELLGETLSTLPRLFRRKKPSGIYLWGLPGRGKTMLMDAAYALAGPFARRLHYHQFLRDLHRKMAPGQGNQADAINDWVGQLVGDARLFCLDEFHLHDVADTLLMEQFLHKLLNRGVQVILTSNYVPEHLLPDPIRHPLALPTIQLIRGYLKVVSLQGEQDYRYRGEVNENYYHWPCGKETDQKLRHTLKILGATWQKRDSVTLSGRSVNTEAVGKQVIWFRFAALCLSARSHLDYLAIAEQWKIVVVSEIHQEQLNQTDGLRRFIWLVDVLYDRRLSLLLSSEHPIADMLRNVPDADVTRAISRLAEMQSIGFGLN